MTDCVEIPYNSALDELPDAVEETREGYAFANPDLDSDVILPGWGQIVTADELRYMVMAGNKLASPADAQTFDSNMLRYYVLQAISHIERRLEFDIFPRWVRYVIEDEDRGLVLPPGEEKGWISPESRLVRESAYPLQVDGKRYWNTFDVFRRPVRRNENLRVVFLDMDRNEAFELPKKWVRLNGDGFYGQIQIVPGRLAETGVGYVDLIGMPLTTSVPGTIGVDYDTGYERAALVPIDLREIIYLTSSWYLYQNFGTAKSPGIASASVSLNSISESYSTTSTSTSGPYGAEQERVEKRMKEWYAQNSFKYRDSFLGSW